MYKLVLEQKMNNLPPKYSNLYHFGPTIDTVNLVRLHSIWPIISCHVCAITEIKKILNLMWKTTWMRHVAAHNWFFNLKTIYFLIFFPFYITIWYRFFIKINILTFFFLFSLLFFLLFLFFLFLFVPSPETSKQILFYQNKNTKKLQYPHLY